MTPAASGTAPLLRLENLSRPGLDPTSLELQDGECIAIRGPSGAGKSLLLRAIADLDPNSGEVFLRGEPRSATAAPEWRRRVSYLAAESAWWSDSVAEHMPDETLAASMLPAMNLPVDGLSWSLNRVSTGEKQRFALARALSLNPSVLLADEPTASLDEATTRSVEALLRARMAEGMGLILVTHATAQAQRLADRVLSIDSGRLSEAPACT